MAMVGYTLGDNWGSGFIGQMVVPGGAQGLHGWTLEFDAGFDITSIWGAEIVSHVGTHYVVRNAAWNADVAAGGQASFGFQATPRSGGTAATGFSLNGTTEGTPATVPPVLSIDDASIVEGDGGSLAMTFRIKLSQAATGPVSVRYATSNGTALAGADYGAASGVVTFAAGETTKTVTVAVNGDTTVESDETFLVSLSAASGATIGDGSATGTIANNDLAPPPVAGSGSIDYRVDSNWGSGFTGSIAVGAGSSALHGWTVGFDATFTITNIWNATIVSHVGNHYVVQNAGWNGDVAGGKAASFGFQATPGSGGTAALGFTINGAAVGSTPVPAPPTLSVADATVVEGNGGTAELAFAVSLSAPAAGAVTVKYATGNGTATAGSDYTAASGTLAFAAGETTKIVRVSVRGDTAVESDETLKLTLSSPTGATVADGEATGTIRNDDVAKVPTLSISDASVAEGSAAAPGVASFTVSLSAAASAPVTVSFATADGTATAAGDYVARAGVLTFAAGETRKTVQVTAIGDSTVEANESFTVVLSKATGATLADASGTGTLVNDDTAPVLPTLAISDASVVEGTPGTAGAGTGWFSTAGNQIVDDAGRPVQLAGVNWFGFESSTLAPHGLWTRGYKEMMDQMKELGFNTIRLPFSNDTLHGGTPNGIDFSRNPDLQGLSALQIMDKIVSYAGTLGLRVILDHHRNDSGAGTSGNGLWYDAQHSEAQWIADWRTLAARYAGDPTVVGADLHNEPYAGTWGGGGATDWAAAAERAGNAIGAVNPNWLIFVEGVANHQGQSYWWGGNLMGVKDRPIALDVANKLVYSAHDYPNSIYPQTWFQGSDFPANLPAKFDQMWGYIYKQGIAPVYIGEFGSKLVDPKDAPWLEAITSYISGDLDNNGSHDLPAGKTGVSWTYFAWNPNSGDTGGILADDWRSVNAAKMTYLTPIESSFGGAPTTHLSFVVSLSRPATQAVTVDYRTVPGDAGSADFVAQSGVVSFAPGEQSKTVTIAVSPDALAEADEHFTVALSNPRGATVADGTGVATIVDDDPVALASAVAAVDAHVFSPYIDMAMPAAADLMKISHDSGISDFTLAFVLGSREGIGWQGQGTIAADGLANGSTILDQVHAVQAAGGNVTISFGGAAGTEAALQAASAGQLQAQYQSVIDRYGVHSLDFDIEGTAMLDQHSLVLRDQALVGLQTANPGLKVSFTLPVLPTGLTADGLHVLQQAKSDGVKIDLVNIMAMDYGPAVDNGGRMGLNAVQASEATQQQLAGIGLDARIGITPMIGVNDIASEVFTLADAQALVDYAKGDPDVAMLSMWSVARDNGGSAGSPHALPDASGIAQDPYAFAHVFHQYDVL